MVPPTPPGGLPLRDGTARHRPRCRHHRTTNGVYQGGKGGALSCPRCAVPCRPLLPLLASLTCCILPGRAGPGRVGYGCFRIGLTGGGGDSSSSSSSSSSSGREEPGVERRFKADVGKGAARPGSGRRTTAPPPLALTAAATDRLQGTTPRPPPQQCRGCSGGCEVSF